MLEAAAVTKGRLDRRSEAVLAQAPILRGLSPDDRAERIGCFDAVRFRAGDCIYRQGERDTRLYVVLAGKVKIGWSSADNPAKLLAVIGPPDIFGAESMFDPGPHADSATALTNVCAAVIDREKLQACIAGSPHVTERLMRVLARGLQRTEDLITDLNFTDVPGRIAKQLLSLSQRFGVRRDNQLHLDHDLTQAEIAQLVCASRESVNKTLSEFAQRGWITVSGKRIVIHQTEPLARRAR
ncbi:cAMP-binding domain of CRP or a regulatory subunit of cAMP-dependent protein kinases [Mycolicibacterium rutilum]|uniref:cAMP-binding domain of CRP or a regulatory subunit of cAMP-dependent protein kinases n=1 Tax=Mycolicibacterium rutilum TaxID=370526 RepID=A0A1H6LV54_MYCRU|nr:Crp/Fnr family transcriptional regulator [Mycolicibacterium rutilum]SEH88921.1 cAMP-binding domain of CRP or a regulatory subunit of cAMP-dependent protein kinases [Mycolicibacterium rutilum]